MSIPHEHTIFGHRYKVAAKLFARGAPEFGAKVAATNLADPGIPAYYVIKNCILAARIQDDWKGDDAYRLRAEEQYANSLQGANERPDDGTLNVLQGLRRELDQLYTSRSRDLAEQTAQPTQTLRPTLWPATPSALPEGWIAHRHPGSGRYYYIHVATQSTQWDFPDPKGLLPQGWTAHLDPRCGRHYYIHVLTQSTQWDFPKSSYKIGGADEEVRVEDEMDNEDEDEDEGEGGDYEGEGGDYEEDDGEDEAEDEQVEEDTEALVQPASEHETLIYDQDSNLNPAADLDLLTGKSTIS